MVRVDATRALRNVKAGLRTASPEIKREFYKGLNRATKPLKTAALANLPKHLPRRGGMASYGAKAARLTTSSASGGISIRSKRGSSWEAGRLRHPVYGNRAVWVSQPITPGWFSKPMEEGAPAVRKELMQVLDVAAKQIAQKCAT